MRRAFLAAPLIGLLGACSLIPNYHRPALPTAQTYPVGAAYGAQPAIGRAAGDIGWREFFPDRHLQELIGIALVNNRDLRVAALNVARAQAQYRVQRADLFPHISLSGIGQFGTLPESTSIASGGFGGGGATSAAANTSTSNAASAVGSTGTGVNGVTGSTAGNAATGTTSALSSANTSVTNTGAGHVSYRYYNVGLGFAAYELDLFGRLRSLSTEAFEQYLSTAETARSTQISLVAEVASAYYTVLADGELLRITRETIASEQRALDLTRQLLTGGSGTLLNVRQAETTVEQARANLALYTRQQAQDENALVLLLGQPLPPDLPLGRGLDNAGLIADLPPGLPSDLLLRRPDIVSAEHTLLAANASIGAARAAFFPSVTLTGSGGVAGSSLSRLFTAGGLTYSFSPQINLPIFTAGQNQGNLDIAKIQTVTEIANYEKAIQTAFREVSDALAGRTTYVDQVASQQRLVDAAADSLRLSLLRFRGGVDSYLPVLQAQQTLYPAQQTLLSLKQAQLTNTINLYKALGGGLFDGPATR